MKGNSIFTYSRLSLSRNQRDPQKHFEISVLRHIRFVVLRKKQFEQPNLINDYVIGLLKLEIYIENIVEKGRNCSPGAISPLFHNICNLILDFCVKTRTSFSLGDKQLFEITEVEITRVDCISNFEPASSSLQAGQPLQLHIAVIIDVESIENTHKM